MDNIGLIIDPLGINQLQLKTGRSLLIQPGPSRWGEEMEKGGAHAHLTLLWLWYPAVELPPPLPLPFCRTPYPPWWSPKYAYQGWKGRDGEKTGGEGVDWGRKGGIMNTCSITDNLSPFLALILLPWSTWTCTSSIAGAVPRSPLGQ